MSSQYAVGRTLIFSIEPRWSQGRKDLASNLAVMRLITAAHMIDVLRTLVDETMERWLNAGARC